MVKQTIAKWLAAGGAVLSVALMVGTAGATELLAPTSTSTAINGGSHVVFGSTFAQGSIARPWVAQIEAVVGRCLRIEVTGEAVDLGMQVTAPRYNLAWRNDDSGGSCFLCPLVKIANTPVSGWYTVTVNHYTGVAVNTNFTLRYASYPVGNINCANPTVPNAVEQNLKAQTNEVSPQVEGEASEDVSVK
ncbi:MAG: hypothetical protein AABY61_00310 [Nitrospirota bacterium]